MATIYKKGSPRSEVVRQIQKALHVFPDGIYGDVTTEAVMNFQRTHGLKVDGVVGPATLAKLLPSVTATALHLKRSTRRIDEIVIHCTATREGQNYTVDDIRRWHTTPKSKGGRGWSDIGYHYVVYLDGSVHNGRDVNIAGAHVENRNSHTIGIVYVGGLDKNGKSKDTRTEAQKAALLSLLLDLRKFYPKAKILGHRDCSPDKNHNGIIEPWEWLKDCPCFSAITEYSRI